MFNWREIARTKDVVCLGGPWYGEICFDGDDTYWGYARKANTTQEVYGDGFHDPDMAGHDLMLKLAKYERDSK